MKLGGCRDTGKWVLCVSYVQSTAQQKAMKVVMSCTCTRYTLKVLLFAIIGPQIPHNGGATCTFFAVPALHPSGTCNLLAT
eukprot:scaffold247780_cov19-Tisochrysis_lutea.AAC.1